MKNAQIPNYLKDRIYEHILNNTDVRIEMNDEEFKYEPKGQALEVGMIRFLIDNDIDVPQRFIQRNKNARKVVQFPFAQELRRMTTVRVYNDQYYCIYTKGAPEYLI